MARTLLALALLLIAGAAGAQQPPVAPIGTVIPPTPLAPPPLMPPPLILTPIEISPAEALAADGAEYARQHHVTLPEAVQRLAAQQDSVAATDALRAEFRDRLTGLVLRHEPNLAFVLLLTGDDPVADRAIVVDGLTIPVLFRAGAVATRTQLLAAIEQHQAELGAALPAPPGIGIDARTGAIALLVRPQDAHAEGADALAAHLTGLAGVPVELMPLSHHDIDLAAVGGSRLIGNDTATNRRSLCTAGFVVTDGVRTAIATAAHCADQLSIIERNMPPLPLTMVGAWGARYQDVQIHVGPEPFPPLFYADAARTRERPLTSWRNRESTRVGDFVCHRGERSGYSCADVAFVDFAPPGELCAGPCPPTWVAVKGPGCRSGDSGGPVFSGTIAFGMVKGASYTRDGICRLYYYMSTDYLPPGWTLLHR